MKGFTLSLFHFIIWWSTVFPSVDKNDVHSSLELQTTHQDETMIKEENNLNIDEYMINMGSDTVNSSQDFFYTQDLRQICHAQVNEFVWKCPTNGDSEKNKILKFRTINDEIYSSTSTWYLQSINEIDIVEMYHMAYMYQIQFWVLIDEQKISLSRLYPTYPEISGFEILQFITNLAFQCQFFIDVQDASDVSTFYSALYGKSYYEYHFEGINLNQNFLFKKIIVKNTTFLNCFEEKIRSHVETKTFIPKSLPELFYKNIQACENAFVSVEFCPITFDTQYIFYRNSFEDCIDWSPIGGFPPINPPPYQRFEILPEDITRILMKKKQKHNISFVKLNRELDKKVIKTYDEIKTQIFDTSFLMGLFSKIFELCFLELKEQKYNPNPEDIFKLYLRPCVIPNINLFLKYYTNVNYSNPPMIKEDTKSFHPFTI